MMMYWLLSGKKAIMCWKLSELLLAPLYQTLAGAPLLDDGAALPDEFEDAAPEVDGDAAPSELGSALRMIGKPSFPEPMTTTLALGDCASKSDLRRHDTVARRATELQLSRSTSRPISAYSSCAARMPGRHTQGNPAIPVRERSYRTSASCSSR